MFAVLTGWFLGLLLGVRHALEPDHMVAVSSMLAEHKGTRGGLLLDVKLKTTSLMRTGRPPESANQARVSLWGVSCPANGGCLALNAVHRLYELCSCIWRRIRNNDAPQAIALAPKDIHAIWHIGTCRLQQCLIKYLLRNAVHLHASLRVTAYCNVPKPWYVAIEVFHDRGQ